MNRADAIVNCSEVLLPLRDNSGGFGEATTKGRQKLISRQSLGTVKLAREQRAPGMHHACVSGVRRCKIGNSTSQVYYGASRINIIRTVK